MKQQEARLRAAADDVRQEINVTANTVPLEEPKEIPAAPEVVAKNATTALEPKAATHEEFFAGELAEQAAPQEEDHLAGANF